MICNNCGTVNSDGTRYCSACGADMFSAAPNNNTNQHQSNNYYNRQSVISVVESKSTISLVCGIVGFMVYGVGLVLGIIAVMQANAVKRLGYNDGKATAGYILGIIDIVTNIISILVFLVYVVFFIIIFGFAMENPG